ncbi:MAG TPA: response regulator transcription factor [Anaerolineales bacterium]|nr:response regulator transcription factor [Anaerolineales bacterium]
MSKTPRILIVDDDETTLDLLSMQLQSEGYQVETASGGAEALEFIRRQVPDLILLDLLMPGIDGLEVCRSVRAFSDVPIIVLSAVGLEDKKVEALDLGADDYLTKPIGVRELKARVRVSQRRRSSKERAAAGKVIRIGDLRLAFLQRQVTVAGREVHLTPIEYELLSELARQRGRIVSHADLLIRGWGPGYQESRNYLHVYMGRLRRKISQAKGVELASKTGVGYVLKAI